MSQASIIRNGNALAGLEGVDTTGAASGDYLTFNGTSWVPARERYTNAEAMTVTVGGWEAGSTFAGLTMQQMWDGLLYPYQYPSFQTFVMVGQTLVLEVGDSTGADPTFTWTTQYPFNIAASSISIDDVTGGTELASGLADDGSESVTLPVITYDTSAIHVFGISGLNTKSEPFSTTTSVSWRWRKYWLETAVTPVGESEITTSPASSILGSTFVGDWVFPAYTPGYKYIVYPSSWGTATEFMDPDTGFPVSMLDLGVPYTVVITNTFGASATYNVHRTYNELNGSITITVS